MQGVGGVDVGAPDLSFLNNINFSAAAGTPPDTGVAGVTAVPGSPNFQGPFVNSGAGNPNVGSLSTTVPNTSVVGTAQGNPAGQPASLPETTTPFTGTEQLPATPNPPTVAGAGGTGIEGADASLTGPTIQAPSLPSTQPLLPPSAPTTAFAPPGGTPFNMGGFMQWFGGIPAESQQQIARAIQSFQNRNA